MRAKLWCPLALAIISVPVGDGQAAPHSRVAVEGGNIVVITGKTRRTLTNLKRDSEPALSPDGQWVLYTRMAKPATSADEGAGDCSERSAPDELRRIKVDGGGDELLVRGRTGSAPEQALCAFQSKQFSSDGATLYFLSPAWTTSSALHTFALGPRTAHYVTPANDFAVLAWCTSEDLKDALIVQQHRYFRFGGSYDWYWLYDSSGQKEIGPVGEFGSVEEIKADLDASGQCGP